MHLLVFGFGPFDRHHFNPSQFIVQALEESGRYLAKARFKVFDVVYREVSGTLDRLLADPGFAGAVGFGVCRRQPAFLLESTARNHVSMTKQDISGHLPESPEIVPGGPASLMSCLDFSGLRLTLAGCGVPADISDQPGDYLCNYAYYRIAHKLFQDSGSPSVPALFVHVPVVNRPDQLQAAEQGLPLKLQLRGARCLLDAVLDVMIQD